MLNSTGAPPTPELSPEIHAPQQFQEEPAVVKLSQCLDAGQVNRVDLERERLSLFLELGKHHFDSTFPQESWLNTSIGYTRNRFWTLLWSFFVWLVKLATTFLRGNEQKDSKVKKVVERGSGRLSELGRVDICFAKHS
jgi:hypothetical protein